MKFLQNLLDEGRQTRLKKTKLGSKHKRAERLAKKSEKDIQETLNVDRYVKAEKFYPGDHKTKKDPRPFKNTFCSQCGGKFGPGMSGYSHCKDHKGVKRVAESIWDGACRKLINFR